MNSYFVIDLASGEILKTVTAIAMTDLAANVGPGQVVTPARFDIDQTRSTWTAANGFQPIAVALDVAQDAAWEAIKTAREAAYNAGVDVAGIGKFDSDLETKVNFLGAIAECTLAMLTSQPLPGRVWTMFDDSRQPLTGEQIIAAGRAVAERVDAIHQRSQDLRERIYAATTAEAATAIEWSMTDD